MDEVDQRRWLILMNQHHFLIMSTWDALSVNANRMKIFWNNTKRCLNHVSQLDQQKTLPGCDEPYAKTMAWSCDMEGHAQKCVERDSELAHEKTEQVVQSFKSLLG